MKVKCSKCGAVVTVKDQEGIESGEYVEMKCQVCEEENWFEVL